MNKIIFSPVLLFLLLIVPVYSAYIDSGIEEKLDEDEIVSVIVKLRDGPIKQKIQFGISQKEKLKLGLSAKRAMISAKQKGVLSKLDIASKEDVRYDKDEIDFKLKHKYSAINGFSGKITRKGLEKLRNDPDVEKIYIDRLMYATLDGSVPQINADDTWSLQLNSTNITGSGETICIVDTGIDYTHPALGGCNISRLALNGSIEVLSTAVESVHPYASNTLYNWTINKPGYSNIAVHFKNMSIEASFDQVKIYDKNWTFVGSFSGIREDVWSPHAKGDTLYIIWQTDPAINGYGFYIDKVINGTTNSSYDWSNCTKVLGGYDFVNSDADPYDGQSHGTHCAGIAASTDSTYGGVAPDAKLIAVKVMNDNDPSSGTDSDVAAGIDWCINNSDKYNISVISMSLGCGSDGCIHWQTACDGDSEVYYSEDPINIANSLGLFVAIAAGNNDWTDGITSPACVSGAVPIGGVNGADSIDFNRGSLLNLLAPGLSIHSTVPGTIFGDKSGTSMATPHVAGAAALIKQFVRLQNGTDISPAAIEDVLDRTGVTVEDNYSRIDIYSAILALDGIAPVISFTDTSSENNSYPLSNSTIINITSNEILDSAWIQFNNTNTTMNGDGISWWINISGQWGYSYEYIVFGNDSAGNLGSSEKRIVNIKYSVPTVASLILNSSDNLNRTNGTLNAFYSLYDGANDTLTNETAWYNNTVEVELLRNLTSITSGNTTKGENWTFGVRAFDGTNYSIWYNVSITIKNALPSIVAIANITVNESEQLNITINASDIDGDVLNYSIDNGNFSLDNIKFVWDTTVNDSGQYIFNITVNDSEDISSILVYTTILDMIDNDGDGIPDYMDTDDDNDGLNDTADYLLGDSTNINSTNVNISILINSSDNLTKIFNSTFTLNITENNLTIVEFNWTFNSSNILNLYNLTIIKQPENASNGSIIVNGLTLLRNQTKKIYVDRISQIDYICIKDAEINSIDNISTGCNQDNEFFIECNGIVTSGGYSCNLTDNSTRYRVTGLNHSAIIEQCQDNDGDGYGIGCTLGNDCNDNDASKNTDCSTPSSPSSSGGGGGGGGGITLTNDPDTLSGSFIFMKSGKKYELSGKRTNLAVTNVAFYVDKFVLSGQLKVNKTNRVSSLDDSGDVYQYFEITPSGLLQNEDIAKAEIEFRIRNSWLEMESIDEDKVSVFRLSDEWRRYNSKFLSKDVNYSYYGANIPGFSYFAIAAEKIEAAEEIVEEAAEKRIVEEVEDAAIDIGKDISDVSGFNYLSLAPVLVFILVVLFILLYRRNNKMKKTGEAMKKEQHVSRHRQHRKKHKRHKTKHH